MDHCHRSTAVVRRSDRAVIGRWHLAGARHRRISREGVDHRRRLIIHRDGLAAAGAVAAAVGRMIRAGDRVVVGAITSITLVRIVADRYRTTAVVRRSHTVVIGCWHFARARYRGVSREGVDHWRRLVIHCDRLTAVAAVAAAVTSMTVPRYGR